MKAKDIENLMTRELLGDTLSPEEQADLQAWIRESDAHLNLYQEIHNETFDSKHYQLYSQIDSEEAWKKFQQKTGIQQQPSLFKRMLKYAAIFTLPLLMGGMAFYFYEQRELFLNEMTEAVVPGSTQAIFKTSGGATLNLNIKVLQTENILIPESKITSSSKGIAIQPNAKPAKAAPKSEESTDPHELRTLSNGEFQITLEDGTNVHLNYNTTLRFPKHFSSKERLVYLKGEAYFDVAKDSVRPFKVMTDQMVVKQYGTSFNVNTYSPTTTEVVLVEGSIGVLSNCKEYAMQPSDKLTFNKETAEIKIEEVDISPYIAWHKGRFVFDNESLGDIMNTLSHWYGVEVIFDDPSVRNLHFTGNMNRYGNLSPILKYISQTVGIRIVMKERKIYIYNK